MAKISPPNQKYQCCGNKFWREIFAVTKVIFLILMIWFDCQFKNNNWNCSQFLRQRNRIVMEFWSIWKNSFERVLIKRCGPDQFWWKHYALREINVKYQNLPYILFSHGWALPKLAPAERIDRNEVLSRPIFQTFNSLLHYEQPSNRDRTFRRKTFPRGIFRRTGTSPCGHFAVRTFWCRNTLPWFFLRYGHSAVNCFVITHPVVAHYIFFR